MTSPVKSPAIICSTSAFVGYSLPATMRLAREAGADGVELLLTPRLARIEADSLREVEARADLPIRSVHTILRLRPVSAETAAEDIGVSARLAGQLRRCATLVVHPPQVTSPHDPPAQHWMQAVMDARERGERAGFQVAVENLGRQAPHDSPTFFDHPERMKRLAQEWELALTYDVAHAGSRGWDVIEVAGAFAPRTANLHLSDLGGRDHRFGLMNAALRDHRLPGDGHLPLQALIEVMRAAGFDGLVTLEVSPVALRAWWPPSLRGRLRAALDFCRQGAPRSQPQPSEQSA